MGMFSFVGDAIGDLTGTTKAAKAGTKAARLAGEATLASTEKNIDFQKWLWQTQTELQQPYMDAGTEGLSDYQNMMDEGFQYDQYSDPSTQFRFNEGQKAVENSASARGMTLSGGQAKDLQRYGQDYASQEYGNAYNRWQTQLGNRYDLATLGQSAASGVGNQGSYMGQNVSQSILQGGQSQANMYQDIGNIQAAGAMGPWNTAMDIAGLAASTYGGKGWGG